MKIRWSALIQQDIDLIKARAAWDDEDDHLAVLLLLKKDRFTDKRIMDELNISNRRYYDLKKELRQIIARILPDKGQ